METLEDYLQYAEEILKSLSIRFETAEAQNQTKTRALTSYTARVRVKVALGTITRCCVKKFSQRC